MDTPDQRNACEPAFMKELMLSPELAAVVGSEIMPRVVVVTELWSYIKEHKLQDSQNRRLINADEKLKKVFGKSQVHMSEMPALIGKHLR
jgi:chromatin remodeling complex protein RSC6